MDPATNHGTKAGIAGGTLLTIFFNIHSSDIIKTIILAAIGAIVSTVVSLVFKYILKKTKS